MNSIVIFFLNKNFIFKCNAFLCFNGDHDDGPTQSQETLVIFSLMKILNLNVIFFSVSIEI